jgi:hypothetical protein
VSRKRWVGGFPFGIDKSLVAILKYDLASEKRSLPWGMELINESCVLFEG